MEKEFIPYEQALALKELGFNKPCFGYYTGDKRHLVLRPSMGRLNEELNDIVCTAPTFSQAFRWFREKYGLEHKILRDSYGCRYQITKVTPTSLEDIDCKGQYPNTSYQEAELACIKKLIEIVKNK